MLQPYLRIKGREVSLLNDQNFREVQNALDAVMRERAKKGLGLTTKRVDIISYAQEDLWEKGLLGYQEPQPLLNSMVFLIGINFALHSVDEHRQLT